MQALFARHRAPVYRWLYRFVGDETVAEDLIDLVYYHEKSVDDAADILGIPRATVKTRMFYARKKLAELIHEI
jgi:DNA-directed RNA polymerase specialized sigma24 family protein